MLHFQRNVPVIWARAESPQDVITKRGRNRRRAEVRIRKRTAFPIRHRVRQVTVRREIAPTRITDWKEIVIPYAGDTVHRRIEGIYRRIKRQRLLDQVPTYRPFERRPA